MKARVKEKVEEKQFPKLMINRIKANNEINELLNDIHSLTMANETKKETLKMISGSASDEFIKKERHEIKTKESLIAVKELRIEQLKEKI